MWIDYLYTAIVAAIVFSAYRFFIFKPFRFRKIYGDWPGYVSKRRVYAHLNELRTELLNKRKAYMETRYPGKIAESLAVDCSDAKRGLKRAIKAARDFDKISPRFRRKYTMLLELSAI
jgi:hypothetical protein